MRANSFGELSFVLWEFADRLVLYVTYGYSWFLQVVLSTSVCMHVPGFFCAIAMDDGTANTEVPWVGIHFPDLD